ncbi:MAG: M20 family peptidase [Micropepsaceae bacterium]
MLRTILVTFSLVLLTLSAIVVGRTLMVPAYVAPAITATKSGFDGGKIASHLGEAVKFRTISWQEGAPAESVQSSKDALIAFRDWISATYPQFAKTATREIISEYSLLYTWQGTDPTLKPLLLMSHMDVVPVAPGSEANWKHDPFAGDIAEGYVWGRGTMDTKAGIIGQLEAAESLLDDGFKPKRTIMFAFGHDEEIGGRDGNEKIAALLAQRKIQLELVDDEGGAITTGVVPGVDSPIALVGVAEKGYVTLELTAHSPGGHSSLPLPIGETAIGRLAHALEKIEASPFESRIDGVSKDFLLRLMPAMQFGPKLAVANLWLLEPLVIRSMNLSPGSAAGLHTTIAPTIIKGGIKENVLPPEATLTINFRIHPRDTSQTIVEHIRRAVDDDQIDIRVSNPGREPSSTSDVHGPQFALIASTLQKVKPGVLVVPNLVSGGTDSRYYSGLTQNVFRIVPAELTADDLKGFHGTNERVPVSSMALIASFYSELIRGADKPLEITKAN